VRFSWPFCHKYRHRPAAAKSLPLFIEKLAETGQTAAPRAQAQGAVEYNAVSLSPEARAWRDDAAVAPTRPTDGEDGLAARPQASVSGPSPRREARAPVPVQATGASAQTDASRRAEEAQLKDDIIPRYDPPQTLPADAGWLRKFRGFVAKTAPTELTGAEVKRFLADLAVRRQVSAAVPHQAFNALRLLFRQVFTRALGDRSGTPRAQRSQYIPMALSRQAVDMLLAELHEP
jgi:Phage integrase, N-terminal SAM-like domain